MKNLNYRITIGFLCFVAFVSCAEGEKKQFAVNESPLADSTVINIVDCMADYSDYNGFIPLNGFIPDALTAVKISEAILFKIYGEEQITGQRPYLTMLKNDIWCLEGRLSEGMKGGVFYIELDKFSGQVLKMLYTE